MYRTILIPTDGSATSELAVDQGLELARLMRSEVTFLHVLENPLTSGYATPETLPYSAQLYQDLKDSAGGILQRATDKAEKAGVQSRTSLVENRDPVQAIVDASERFDAVVMGTHGRRGFNRWMFGSVAEGALRRSTKPFLMIRGGLDED
ncbi:MAG TPA: universal stress protein [Trueperaceae bacterium]|nr:universal stress protein [Trueperaceae bacterium]